MKYAWSLLSLQNENNRKKMINNYLDSLWTEASQDIPDRFFLIVQIPAVF